MSTLAALKLDKLVINIVVKIQTKNLGRTFTNKMKKDTCHLTFHSHPVIFYTKIWWSKISWHKPRMHNKKHEI